MINVDFLIIGGGIIGINIARELKKQFSDTKVIVIEKENELGMHASGRNSGVLHAGFYYSPDSLKAKLTKTGNKLLTEYCDNNKIAINKCGKLVVAKNADELKSLDELFKRGRINGIDLVEISEEEAKEIEPRVKTYKRALYSPTTSTVNPVEVMQLMKRDAMNEGIQIHQGVCFIRRNAKNIFTSKDTYQAGYVVNAAGLYADKIAMEFGFSEKYRILPFKGLYLYSDEPASSIKTNVYPVPNLKNPFLGVHFTVTVDGKHKIGPTAIPAFWREHYKGFENFNLSETLEIIKREAGLFASSNFDFKRLAFEELTKYSRSHMVTLASSLVENIKKTISRNGANQGYVLSCLILKKRNLKWIL